MYFVCLIQMLLSNQMNRYYSQHPPPVATARTLCVNPLFYSRLCCSQRVNGSRINCSVGVRAKVAGINFHRLSRGLGIDKRASPWSYTAAAAAAAIFSRTSAKRQPISLFSAQTRRRRRSLTTLYVIRRPNSVFPAGVPRKPRL